MSGRLQQPPPRGSALHRMVFFDTAMAFAAFCAGAAPAWPNPHAAFQFLLSVIVWFVLRHHREPATPVDSITHKFRDAGDRARQGLDEDGGAP